MSITYKSTALKGGKDKHTFVFDLKTTTKNSSKTAVKDIPKLKTNELFSVYSASTDGTNTTFLKLKETKNVSKEDLRVIGGRFYKEYKKLKSKKLLLNIKDFQIFSDTSDSDALQGFVEGFLLSDYKLQEVKSSASKKEVLDIEVCTSGLKPAKVTELKSQLKESENVSDAVHFARRLGDLPGNMMTPSILAKNASILAKNAESIKSPALKVTVWNKARIKKEKMGGLLGVSLGSAEEPKFIIMEYKPKGLKAKSTPTVLVGKGLTFDAGGISIKPSAKMDEMRYDMCGGAAVIGAMKLICDMKLKAHVIALVPSTENLLGASAVKPGDVLTARNGKTIEVLNTDAEGRLILADALAYASELGAKEILSTATLTGAMVVALGNSHTGFFTRDDKLAKKIDETSKISGENLWRMPLTDDHVSDMQGSYADLSNLASFRGAGSATAAAFLEQFVSKDVPYAHLDIAGTAWNAAKRKSYHASNGATGVLVRSFYEYVKNA